MFQYRVTHKNSRPRGSLPTISTLAQLNHPSYTMYQNIGIGLTLKTLSKALVYSITAILPCFGPENDFGPDQLQHAS